MEVYVRYRPTYPDGVLKVLRDESCFTATSVIADFGSGTGISSELFLRHGNVVFGVDPNAEMRQAADAQLGQQPGFRSIAATAEVTTLPTGSVDYVVAGQAFHSFDRQKAQREFTRILRPNGWVVLLWNSRRTDSTPFLRAYEMLLQPYGIDYREIQRQIIDFQVLEAFFDGGEFMRRSLDNEQRFDFEGPNGGSYPLLTRQPKTTRTTNRCWAS